MKGHIAWHRLLKYSQNQRFTTQFESMEGSQIIWLTVNAALRPDYVRNKESHGCFA